MNVSWCCITILFYIWVMAGFCGVMLVLCGSHFSSFSRESAMNPLGLLLECSSRKHIIFNQEVDEKHRCHHDHNIDVSLGGWHPQYSYATCYDLVPLVVMLLMSPWASDDAFLWKNKAIPLHFQDTIQREIESQNRIDTTITEKNDRLQLKILQ